MNSLSRSSKRKVRAISGRIAVSGGVPSIAAGVGFTITDGGAGRVTVTLNDKGRVILSAIAMPIESTAATSFSCKALSVSESAVEFGVYQADGTDGVLVDNVGFSFDIKVSDVRL